jgi:hypothetical protein
LKYRLGSWLVIAIGAVTIAAGVLGWTGTLPYNEWLGVRTEASLSSVENWRATNAHAGPLIVVAGLVIAAAGAVSLWLGRSDASPTKRWWVSVGGLGLGVVLLIAASFCH